LSGALLAAVVARIAQENGGSRGGIGSRGRLN
jgi:hypothetical protein